MTMRAPALVALWAGSLFGQLIQPGAPVPKKDKPPVVFLNGYQSDCSSASFSDTFGTADQILQSNGEVSLFFNNCSFPGKPAIEDLGSFFGTFLGGLKYDDGTAVNTVDVVAHSLGGLIVRSYLSGKQTTAGLFQPPATVRIRKAVFIATPHFGTGIVNLLGFGATQLDEQLDELASGSQFLFDLATWNQGTDDLRGIDAIALAGSGGTGAVTNTPGFDDGVASTSSESLNFAESGRTRVVPYCHIDGGGLISVVGFCSASAQGIADFRSATDTNVKIVLSFLNGTADWMTTGTAAEADPILSKNGGLQVAVRAANDTAVQPDSVTAVSGSVSKPLNVTSHDVAYTDLLPAGIVTLTSVAGSTTTTGQFTLPPATYDAIVFKPGPIIGRVYPAASLAFPLTVAPGEFIAVYGTALAGSTATAASSNYPTQLADTQVLVNGKAAQLYFVSPGQIDAVVPDDANGLVKFTVQNTAGSHTVNVFVDVTTPAIFTQAASGAGPASALNAVTNQLVTAANPLHPGDFLALYLTGLGATTVRDGLEWANTQPTVTIGGKACAVSYAGRAPGFKGLDQINCVVPVGLTSDPQTPVFVTAGSRGSNIATVAIAQ
jgi:uncharacterized protein (TIGR03437 family)